MRAKIEGWKVPEGRKSRSGLMTHAEAADSLKVDEPAAEEIEQKTEFDRLAEDARCLVHRLLLELEMSTSHNQLILDTIDEETEHDRDGKRRYAMKQAVSLSRRASTLREITTALKVLAPKPEPAEKEDKNVPKGKKAKRLEEAEELSSEGIFGTPKLVVNG